MLEKYKKRRIYYFPRNLYNKFKEGFWFVRRPNLYPHLLDKAKQRLFKEKETRQEAEKLCAKFAMDTYKAIEELTGKPVPIKVNSLFSNYFKRAEQTISEIPESKKMGGSGNIELIYWLAEHIKIKNAIETGVAYGWSTLAFLLSLNNRKDKNVKLISTDRPYINKNNEKYVGCVVPNEFRTMWCLLRNADKQALPKALKILNNIDMCHYDSDKSYAGRMWAYPLLWEALKPGGFFISDDIGDNMAFFEYAKQVACDPVVIESWRTQDSVHYVGVLKKP